MKRGERKAEAVVQVRTRILLEDETAAYLRVSVHTLKKWRQTGKGPRFANYGVITYAVDDLEDFRNKHLRNSTSDLIEEDGAATGGPPPL